MAAIILSFVNFIISLWIWNDIQIWHFSIDLSPDLWIWPLPGHCTMYTFTIAMFYYLKSTAPAISSLSFIAELDNFRWNNTAGSLFLHVLQLQVQSSSGTSEDLVCWSNKTVFCCSNLISKTKTMSPALLFCSFSLRSVLLMSLSLSSGPIMQHVLSDWTTYCFSNQYHCVTVCVSDCVYVCKCLCI